MEQIFTSEYSNERWSDRRVQSAWEANKQAARWLNGRARRRWNSAETRASLSPDFIETFDFFIAYVEAFIAKYFLLF